MALVIAAGVVFYVGVYVWGMHSSAYKYLDSVVRRSPEIHRLVGAVKSVRLAVVGGYSENYTYETTRATITLVVDGSRGEVTVRAKVEEIGGNWKILETWINGKSAALD